jgi:translocation and assembly module TamB
VRNIFSGLYWVLLISFLTLVCVLALLIGTPKGTSFLVQKGTEISGQKIAISNLNGTILSGLKASNIAFTNENLQLQLQDVEFEPSYSALLKKELRIKKLKAEVIDVILPDNKETTEDKPEAIKPPEFLSPINIDIDSLEIGTLTIQASDNPIKYRNIQLSGSLHQSNLKITHLHGDFQTYSLDASGDFSFAKPFPLFIQADLTENNNSTVHAKMEGTIENYQLTAAANINNPSAPPFTAQLLSNGNLTHLNVNKLTTQILDNTLIVTGKIDWEKRLQIDTEFSARDFNPQTIVAGLPGKILLTGKASLVDQTLNTQINATGELRDAPLKLKTELSLHDNVADIHSAKISLGSNTATLKGHLSPIHAEDIIYHLDASDLSSLYPDLSGKVFASGNLNGKWKQLRIKSKLEGELISYQNYHARALELNLLPSAKSDEYTLDFQARNISSGEQSIELFSIHGKGNQRKHDFHFDLQGGPLETVLSANINGDLKTEKGTWRGDLTDLHISAEDLPDYHQEQSTRISLSKSQQNISELCLQGPTEKLCLDGEINLANKSFINANLKQLPLKRLAPWIPFSKELPEQLSSEFKITGNKKIWQVDTRSELDSNNRMDAILSLNTDQNTVEGDITARFNKLQWINLFTEKLHQPSGKLNANLKLSGRVANPDVLGTIRLTDAAAHIPVTGTEIGDVNLLIDLQSNQSAILSGKFKSGKGTATLKGQAHWPQRPHWNADLQIDGYNLQAANLPIARINISPSLRLKGNEKEINVKGIVSVPNADIRIKDLPTNTIKASPDEKIIGESIVQPQQDNPRSALTLNTAVDIRLGSEVNFEGFGLDTDIEGGLKLRNRPGKPLNADGTLTMVGGKYTAYGRELTIEHGAFYFNGPLDEPRMNLRVINPIDNVKVGLAITGSPQQPESQLFSTPPMSETEALSYLLTGKPLNATGDSESGMLVNAAAKLGMKKSAHRINEIRAKAGFDTLQLESGDDLTESELIIGKYLSARLYLEYVTKLFASSEVFTLRYEFSNKLYLEAESGAESQALDLIYQFER